MAKKTDSNGQADTPQAAGKPLTAVPFVIDGFVYSKPRAWQAKPDSDTPTRRTAVLGAVTFRIAGSAVTFNRDVALVIDSDGAKPSGYVDVPFDGAKYGAKPLFVSDTDTAASDLDRFYGDAATKFFAWYRQQQTAHPSDERLLRDLTHAEIAKHIGRKTGRVMAAL